MKKKLFYFFALTLVSIFTLKTGNFALSEPSGVFKVGVINISEIVESSSEIKALKNYQNKNYEELKNWVDSARENVTTQETKEDKEKLSKKYEAELAKKQTSFSKEITSKLESIDKSINTVIQERCNLLNYNLVLTKNSVLYGGEDITDNIIKYIK